MATKDWKKSPSSVSPGGRWMHKTKPLTLDVGKGLSYSAKTKQMEWDNNKWIVNINKNRKTIIGKIFKTKTSALAYARAYMRKH